MALIRVAGASWLLLTAAASAEEAGRCAWTSTANGDEISEDDASLMQLRGHMNSSGLGASGALASCAKVVPLPVSSPWSTGTFSYSCTGSPIRGDGAFACADAQGNVDSTSLYVDMGSVQNKVGCFEWVTNDCSFSMKRVSRIEFDIEWQNCENLWMAPIWTTPSPWIAPQGLSGEIDFVEECPVPSVATNLGCYSVSSHGCHDAQHWGQGSGSGGTRHFVTTLDSTGNLEAMVCAQDGSACNVVASYAGWRSAVHATSNGNDYPFHFVSDVWNNRGGDGGWSGCRAVQNAGTQCKYAVTNIKVTSNDGKPMWGDITSKCSTMDAKQQVQGTARSSGPPIQTDTVERSSSPPEAESIEK